MIKELWHIQIKLMAFLVINIHGHLEPIKLDVGTMKIIHCFIIVHKTLIKQHFWRLISTMTKNPIIYDYLNKVQIFNRHLKVNCQFDPSSGCYCCIYINAGKILHTDHISPLLLFKHWPEWRSLSLFIVDAKACASASYQIGKLVDPVSSHTRCGPCFAQDNTL